MAKVKRLETKAQPANWFETVTNECKRYPIYLVDIEQNELVVDIGANVGGFFEAWKNKFTNWIAVEPSAYNCEEYLKNTGRKVEVQKAAYKVSGDTLKLQAYKVDNDFDTPSGNFGVTGFINDYNKHGWQGDYELVETISFEDLIGNGEIGLLKIDCEGAEYDFLMGKDLSKIKYIIGEFHNFLGGVKQMELFTHIKQTHEQIYSEGDGNKSHFVKLWKRK